MDGLGIADGWVQAIEDDTAKEDNNKKDLDGADNIVYIGQHFKNLAILSKY